MLFIDSGTADLAQLKVGNSKFSRIKTLGQQLLVEGVGVHPIEGHPVALLAPADQGLHGPAGVGHGLDRVADDRVQLRKKLS